MKVEKCFKPLKMVKLENTVCIIFLMHQSTNMVSVATFEWLTKMVKFIQSSYWKIKGGASEVYLYSAVGTNSSYIINQGIQTFDE